MVFRNSNGKILLSPRIGNFSNPVEISASKIQVDAEVDGVSPAARYYLDDSNQFMTPDINNNYIWVFPIYGQSNSNGTSASSPPSTSTNYSGITYYMGTDGRFFSGTGDWASNDTETYNFSLVSGLQDLVSNIRETMAPTVGNFLNDRAQSKVSENFRCCFSVHGIGGRSYQQLEHGTIAFTNLVNGVNRMVELCSSLGYNVIIGGVLWNQGENHVGLSTRGTYQGYLEDLYADIQTYLLPLTAQSLRIPLLLAQQSNFCISGWENEINNVVYDQLQAHIDNPGNIICVGPMYQGATLGSGNLHYTGSETVKWAQAYANAVAELYQGSGVFEPLRPKTITRIGADVYIEFYIEKTPLVLDTTTITNYADSNYGFRYTDDAGIVSISSVAIEDADRIKITLSSSTLGTNPKIIAGYSPSSSVQVSGPATGARVALRDSFNDDALKCNFCVHFELNVP